MHIEINTDHNIEGHKKLTDKVQSMVEKALSRFSDRITLVDIHLSDANAQKSGQEDKHCMMEVHLVGHQPTAVTNQAATLDQAIAGAAAKLKRSLKSTLGRESTLLRLRDHH